MKSKHPVARIADFLATMLQTNEFSVNDLRNWVKTQSVVDVALVCDAQHDDVYWQVRDWSDNLQDYSDREIESRIADDLGFSMGRDGEWVRP